MPTRASESSTAQALAATVHDLHGWTFRPAAGAVRPFDLRIAGRRIGEIQRNAILRHDPVAGGGDAE
jgi:hypothetical protein